MRPYVLLLPFRVWWHSSRNTWNKEHISKSRVCKTLPQTKIFKAKACILMLPPFPSLRQGHPGYVLQERLEHPSLEKLTTHTREMAFFCWLWYPWESMLATHPGQGFSPCHNWHSVSNNSLLWGDVPFITESLVAWLLSLTYQGSYNLFRLKNVSSGHGAVTSVKFITSHFLRTAFEYVISLLSTPQPKDKRQENNAESPATNSHAD